MQVSFALSQKLRFYTGQSWASPKDSQECIATAVHIDNRQGKHQKQNQK